MNTEAAVEHKREATALAGDEWQNVIASWFLRVCEAWAAFQKQENTKTQSPNKTVLGRHYMGSQETGFQLHVHHQQAVWPQKKNHVTSLGLIYYESEDLN